MREPSGDHFGLEASLVVVTWVRLVPSGWMVQMSLSLVEEQVGGLVQVSCRASNAITAEGAQSNPNAAIDGPIVSSTGFGLATVAIRAPVPSPYTICLPLGLQAGME